MFFYLRGEIDFGDTDSLIERFFDRASVGLRAESFGFVGRVAENNEGAIPKETMERLTALWEKRVSLFEGSGDPTRHQKGSEAFGWWFRSSQFDG